MRKLLYCTKIIPIKELEKRGYNIYQITPTIEMQRDAVRINYCLVSKKEVKV